VKVTLYDSENLTKKEKKKLKTELKTEIALYPMKSYSGWSSLLLGLNKARVYLLLAERAVSHTWKSQGSQRNALSMCFQSRIKV